MCFIGEFITTYVWWSRIHPWYAYGYNSASIVYIALEVNWISSLIVLILFLLYFFIYAFLKIFITGAFVRRKFNVYKKLNLIFLISLVIPLYLTASISGIIASSYALKKEKVNGESIKCLRYILNGYQGTKDWVEGQSLK